MLKEFLEACVVLKEFLEACIFLFTIILLCFVIYGAFFSLGADNCDVFWSCRVKIIWSLQKNFREAVFWHGHHFVELESDFILTFVLAYLNGTVY